MKTILSSETMDIPESVAIKVHAKVIEVEGPRGKLTRDFKHLNLDFQLIKDDVTGKRQLKIDSWFGSRKASASIRTALSHVSNLIAGVTQGFLYKMRFVYAHFPINASISANNKSIEIRNFLGMSASSLFNFPLIRLRSLSHLPLSSLRSVSVPISQRKLPTFRAFSGTAMTTDAKDAGMDAVQRRLMFEDECILVDETDRVVGHDSKYNCHLMENIEAKNLLHRAFSVFLFNSNYELLLQQRSKAKVTFPLVWTNTCCSHPLYRDSELIEENTLGVRNAAQRKLLDELGIVAEDVPVDEFTPLGRMLYKAPSDGKWGEHELDYLLFIVRDVKVQPNPDVKYVSREELKELVKKADSGEEGLKLSPWFRLVVDNFLMKWWDHVEKGTLSEAVDMKTIHKL